MSFRSKASQINAENYVRIKKEASANVPLRTTSKTTKPNSHSLQFGPFEPKKTSLKTSISTNDPPNRSMSSNSKSSMPNNYPSNTSMTTTTLKPLINPCAKSSHDIAKRSQVVLPESSNGIGKSSIPSKSTAPTNDPATFKSSTLINPFTKSSNGISKSFMPTTFKPSAVTNDLSINTKPTNPKSFTNASTKSSTFTNACSQMHVDTQVLDEGLQTEEAVEKSCEGKQHPNAKENEIKAPNKTKKVWKPGGKVQWTESIDVDPDEVVEVEEIRENEPPKLGVMEGTLVAKHVWCLPPGRRIIVHFNEYDQPVRKGGLVLVHFLSDLSKDASFCPLGAHTWKHVDDHYKERIIKTVHDKFVLPDRTEICRMLLLFVNLKWKHYKWKLHQAYYNPNMSKEKMIEKKPENVTKEQWINLVSYWCSEKFKTLSSLGKRAREMQDQVRTTGSQSYARGKCDFVKEYGREPTSLEWWKRSHVKKNGGYVDGTRTREFLETAENIVDERLCTSDQTREVIETEVFNELMYDAEKPNQRLVGYGVGVTRNHVFGPEAIYRKAKLGNGGVISSEVMSIKSYLVSAERKSDEVLSELQKRNEDLEKANEELRAKNEQVLAQLNRVASFIEKHEQTQG